jgi:hypothetical protein
MIDAIRGPHACATRRQPHYRDRFALNLSKRFKPDARTLHEIARGVNSAQRSGRAELRRARSDLCERSDVPSSMDVRAGDA